MIQKFLLNTQIMEDIYKIIEKHNPNKKRKLLIVFDDMIAYMLSNKKYNPIVTELFIRGRKLKISFVFIAQSYFDVPKKIRLNSTHYFNMRQKTTLFFSKDNLNKLHLIILQILTFKTFLVIDTTLASDNPLCFRKNFVERI